MSSKIKERIKDRKPQKRNSVSETLFRDKLVEVYGDDVIHKFRIDDINHEYDFYVPSKNLIVEFDGDYWHGNKKNQTLTPRMKQQYQIDKSFTNAAIKKGYSVHRVWQSESENYPSILRVI